MRHLIILILCLLTTPALAAEQVPFGDKISDKIFNYHRHTPSLATAGKLAPGGVAELKDKGFKTIIDIRSPAEGIEEERKAAAEVGIAYHNLPVRKGFPDAAFFKSLDKLLADPSNYPLMLHCGSANRVGMVWAARQINRGVELEQALLEGRTIGMRASREQQLKENMGQLK